jgi:hypothetical protein
LTPRSSVATTVWAKSRISTREIYRTRAELVRPGLSHTKC